MSFPANGCQNCGRIPSVGWRKLGVCLCGKPRFISIKWHFHHCSKCSKKTGHKAACLKPVESDGDQCGDKSIQIAIQPHPIEDEIIEEVEKPKACRCGYVPPSWDDKWQHLDFSCPIARRCPDCKQVVLKSEADNHWETCRPLTHQQSSGQRFRQGGLCNGK
jgi:hypothetical protein